jgi:hypothetical protein
VDLRYGLTQNLAADFTYNTDFAQVEADEQHVNLTRFSLFVSEKREFFLENQGSSASGASPPTRPAIPRCSSTVAASDSTEDGPCPSRKAAG